MGGQRVIIWFKWFRRWQGFYFLWLNLLLKYIDDDLGF